MMQLIIIPKGYQSIQEEDLIRLINDYGSLRRAARELNLPYGQIYRFLHRHGYAFGRNSTVRKGQ